MSNNKQVQDRVAGSHDRHVIWFSGVSFGAGLVAIGWGLATGRMLAPLVGLVLVVLAFMGPGLASFSLQLGDYVLKATKRRW